MITILLGQQTGFIEHPCFMCEWDSRVCDQHYRRKDWPLRKGLDPGSKNAMNEHLVPPSKVILPPLHVKLGSIKQLVKAMRINHSEAFNHLFLKFPKLSEAKINEGVLDRLHIWALLIDTELKKMTSIEEAAWQSFKDVVSKFLGKKRILIRKT